MEAGEEGESLYFVFASLPFRTRRVEYITLVALVLRSRLGNLAPYRDGRRVSCAGRSYAQDTTR